MATKIFRNFENQKYDHTNAHTLILSGWAVSPENQKGSFALWGDGKELFGLEPEYVNRPDVSRNLRRLGKIKDAGFVVRIPEILKLADKYRKLELRLTMGDRTVVLWKADTDKLKLFCADSVLEYYVDREQIMSSNTLMIDGWVLDEKQPAKVLVKDHSGKPLKCSITRSRRPDVEEARGLQPEKERKIGFSVRIDLNKISERNIYIHFKGRVASKVYKISISKLRKKDSILYQRMNLLRPKNGRKNLSYIREKGFREFIRYVENYQPEGRSQDYEIWLREHAAGKRELKKQRETVFSRTPLISIVIPMYNTPEEYLKELLDSVTGQSYRNWQLCLADGSEDDRIGSFIQEKYGEDKRIVYKKLKENRGISENTNAAIDLAAGEYVLLCDHDDVLTPDALFHIAKAITEKNADVIYTDEDKVSMDGKHYFEPNFKPDFNLFRLRENNYICHIFAFRKNLLDKVGAFRSEYDGAQDFDLILRCCEQTEHIVHIPRVLYHWRSHMNSTAANPESKRYAFEAGRRAIEDHYRRLGIQAEVEMTKHPGWYRSHVVITGEPLISIIIPNKDHIEDLDLCVTSIEEKSTWKNYEILVVENNSENKETFVYYEELQRRYDNVRVFTWKKEFNYSAINNFAVRESRGEYLLFLNNDVEIITPSWMEEMLQICQQKGVGMVGAKLYYPDDTIQHVGVVIGLGGIAGHVMCKAPGNEIGYMGRLISVQEISAVTAACMLVKASVFKTAGGFDEKLKVAFNDIDLCMQVRSMNEKIVFTPYAELYHYESKSRGMEDTPEKVARFSREVKCFRDKWKKELQAGDPYYSPNLTLKAGDCSLQKMEERNEEYDV